MSSQPTMNDFYQNTPLSAKKTRGKAKTKLMNDGTAITAKSFPSDQFERFLALLRSNRVLWDASLAITQRDAQTKEKAWEVMAAQLAISIPILKAKYKCLRTKVNLLFLSNLILYLYFCYIS